MRNRNLIRAHLAQARLARSRRSSRLAGDRIFKTHVWRAQRNKRLHAAITHSRLSMHNAPRLRHPTIRSFGFCSAMPRALTDVIRKRWTLIHAAFA